MRVILVYCEIDEQSAVESRQILEQEGAEVVGSVTIGIQLTSTTEEVAARAHNLLSESVDCFLLLTSVGAETTSGFQTFLGAFSGAARAVGVLRRVYTLFLGPHDVLLRSSSVAKNVGLDVRALEKGGLAGSVFRIVQIARPTVAFNTASKVEVKRELQERQAVIKEEAATFITKAIASLGEREKQWSGRAAVWQATGFGTLVVGAVVLYRLFQDGLDVVQGSSIGVALAVYFGLRALVLVGFAAAGAKYAFDLGKAFQLESLKNSDRIHAIRFGEFFLGAYGATAPWEQVREAFQHWNIEQPSAFSRLTAHAADPQSTTILRELLANVAQSDGAPAPATETEPRKPKVSRAR